MKPILLSESSSSSIEPQSPENPRPKTTSVKLDETGLNVPASQQQSENNIISIGSAFSEQKPNNSANNNTRLNKFSLDKFLSELEQSQGEPPIKFIYKTGDKSESITKEEFREYAKQFIQKFKNNESFNNSKILKKDQNGEIYFVIEINNLQFRIYLNPLEHCNLEQLGLQYNKQDNTITFQNQILMKYTDTPFYKSEIFEENREDIYLLFDSDDCNLWKISTDNTYIFNTSNKKFKNSSSKIPKKISEIIQNISGNNKSNALEKSLALIKRSLDNQPQEMPTNIFLVQQSGNKIPITLENFKEYANFIMKQSKNNSMALTNTKSQLFKIDENGKNFLELEINGKLSRIDINYTPELRNNAVEVFNNENNAEAKRKAILEQKMKNIKSKLPDTTYLEKLPNNRKNNKSRKVNSNDNEIPEEIEGEEEHYANNFHENNSHNSQSIKNSTRAATIPEVSSINESAVNKINNKRKNAITGSKSIMSGIVKSVGEKLSAQTSSSNQGAEAAANSKNLLESSISQVVSEFLKKNYADYIITDNDSIILYKTKNIQKGNELLIYNYKTNKFILISQNLFFIFQDFINNSVNGKSKKYIIFKVFNNYLIIDDNNIYLLFKEKYYVLAEEFNRIIFNEISSNNTIRTISGLVNSNSNMNDKDFLNFIGKIELETLNQSKINEYLKELSKNKKKMYEPFLIQKRQSLLKLNNSATKFGSNAFIEHSVDNNNLKNSLLPTNSRKPQGGVRKIFSKIGSFISRPFSKKNKQPQIQNLN